MVIVCLFSVSLFFSKSCVSNGSSKTKQTKNLFWYSQTEEFQAIFLVTGGPMIEIVIRECCKILPLFRNFTVHITPILQEGYNEQMEF